jgi:hypothetical protein
MTLVALLMVPVVQAMQPILLWKKLKLRAEKLLQMAQVLQTKREFQK